MKRDELKAMAAALGDILNGKQVERGVDSPFMSLIIHGLVEIDEINKPCKTCGTPILDHRQERVTGAGRLFLAAMDSSL